MTEQTKSIVRHILTALGAILMFLGLGKFTGIVDFLLENLDAVWQAIMVVIGFLTSLLGFFKNKERLEERTNK